MAIPFSFWQQNGACVDLSNLFELMRNVEEIGHYDNEMYNEKIRLHFYSYYKDDFPSLPLRILAVNKNIACQHFLST